MPATELGSRGWDACPLKIRAWKEIPPMKIKGGLWMGFWKYKLWDGECKKRKMIPNGKADISGKVEFELLTDGYCLAEPASAWQLSNVKWRVWAWGGQESGSMWRGSLKSDQVGPWTGVSLMTEILGDQENTPHTSLMTEALSSLLSVSKIKGTPPFTQEMCLCMHSNLLLPCIQDREGYKACITQAPPWSLEAEQWYLNDQC